MEQDQDQEQELLDNVIPKPGVPQSAIDALPRCELCQDVVVMPVSLSCCTHARLFCSDCMRTALELEKQPLSRRTAPLRFSCGCTVRCVSASESTMVPQYAISTYVLDPCVSTRCMYGCGAVLDTQRAVHTHISSPLWEGGCPHAPTMCRVCCQRGPRREIEGAPHVRGHMVMRCRVCNVDFVTVQELADHVALHE